MHHKPRFLTKDFAVYALLLNLGLFFSAAGIHLFKTPNHFAMGGTSGVSIILASLFPTLNVGGALFLINAALVALGLVFLGAKTMGVTIYSSFALSAFVSLLEKVNPMPHPFTDDTLLELCFAVALPAIGSAIVFNVGASTGGTDIVAMILKSKTNINIGQCLLFVDFTITVVSGIAFGIETGMFSLLGLALKSVIVDMVLENIAVHKCFQIITSKPEQIIDFIVKDLHRGATDMQGEGAYTHENKTVILTVVNRAQAIKLRLYAKSVDPSCFILIMNTTEIIGKGFRGVM